MTLRLTIILERIIYWSAIAMPFIAVAPGLAALIGGVR